MSRYLVVAYQTASSPELLERLKRLAAEDRTAEFALLLPATPTGDLLTWTEGEATAVAAKAADAARQEMERSGLRVTRASVGDPSPLMAIEDELRDHQELYDAIVICTFPAGISRWLRLDIVHQAERRFALPVIHVVAERRPAPVRP